MLASLIVANWKMHGSLQENAKLLDGLLSGISKVHPLNVAVCPPFPYLGQVREMLHGSAVEIGAQNVCPIEAGAHTGEVSIPMLKDFDCRYVIVGHSERRTLYKEDDASIAKKFWAVKSSGLTPILCVGESLVDREQGKTMSVINDQLNAVHRFSDGDDFSGSVIAYEPVWAIGTGVTATADQIQEVHSYIRSQCKNNYSTTNESVKIVYGGSVNPQNAQSIFSLEDVDGGLVGGASLNGESFAKICTSAFP